MRLPLRVARPPRPRAPPPPVPLRAPPQSKPLVLHPHVPRHALAAHVLAHAPPRATVERQAPRHLLVHRQPAGPGPAALDARAGHDTLCLGEPAEPRHLRLRPLPRRDARVAQPELPPPALPPVLLTILFHHARLPRSGRRHRAALHRLALADVPRAQRLPDLHAPRPGERVARAPLCDLHLRRHRRRLLVDPLRRRRHGRRPRAASARRVLEPDHRRGLRLGRLHLDRHRLPPLPLPPLRRLPPLPPVPPPLPHRPHVPVHRRPRRLDGRPLDRHVESALVSP